MEELGLWRYEGDAPREGMVDLDDVREGFVEGGELRVDRHRWL